MEPVVWIFVIICGIGAIVAGVFGDPVLTSVGILERCLWG